MPRAWKSPFAIAAPTRNPGLSKEVNVLLTGSIPGHTEPVAWTRIHNGGRVFYTSLGHREDVWTNPKWQQHLMGGIAWTLGQAK